MTKVFKKFKSFSMSTKIQIIISFLLLICLAVAIPVYAWFTTERKIAELAKIKAPDNLYINAAHKEDVINLDMTSVNVSRKKANGVDPVTSASYVFSVSGEWVSTYTLQIEHTTNVPFTYTICEAKIYKSISDMKTDNPAGYANTADYESENADGSLKYVEYVATNVFDTEEMNKITADRWEDDGLDIEDGEKYYIWIGDEITNIENAHGAYLNMNGSGTATNTYTDKSYETGTYKQKNADPVFWQLKNIRATTDNSKKGKPFYNTYVIKISWDEVDNISDYNKETDIFYISVFVD